MKCGPDGCPILAWTNLPPEEQRAQRKAKAWELYNEGFTEQAIAKLFNSSQPTIHRDLEGFIHMNKPPRPKGGRPKAARPKPKSHEKVVLLADRGVSKKTIAIETGLGERMVDRVLEVEKARREGQADPIIDPATLSVTAQEKLAAAIRQHKRTLDLSFSAAVSEKVRKHMDEILLPDLKKKIDQAQELFTRRRGLMNKDTFNIIRRALHPDSRNSISDRKLGEAFDAFMALEKFLLDEKSSPTDFPSLPKTWADWEKAKQAATAERRAKRQTRSNLARQ
jgi:hypothetical protein